jgi:thiamine pyrophosphate-dependent acetolactate synthase large subunit-like protein
VTSEVMAGPGGRMPASGRGGSRAAAAAIVAALARAGTRLLFGVPGGGPNLDVVGAADLAQLTSELAAALDRGGPTVIDARLDPATYPAVMDLTRGEAGRRASAGPRPASAGRHPPTGP